MYPSFKSFKPKAYSATKQDIKDLPLADFLEELLDTRAMVSSSRSRMYEEEIEKAQLRFLETWNMSHEESYEGSFEELDLEAKVRAKLGDLPDLGSDARVVEVFTRFAKDWNMPKNADWFFSQTQARFAQLKLVKNSNGYSAKALYLDHIAKSKELLAIWHLVRFSARSALVEKQIDVRYRDYCSLVPIIMAAFKRHNDIGYEEWDRSEVHGIVEEKLAQAMLLDEVPQLTTEEWLAERDAAIMWKSGDKEGTPRNPATTYQMYPSKGSVLLEVPPLARIMLCQTWCAHPSNRTRLMVLSPTEWDGLPQPLVSSRVLSNTTPSHSRNISDNPYEE